MILAVLIAVGLLLFYIDRRKPHHGHSAASSAPENSEEEKKDEVCCGLHAVCEKKYSVKAGATPEYYDDEELDVLSGRDPSTFTADEIEQLREVVLTLRPEDAWGWSRSLEMRHIELPAEIRDELLILLSSDS